MNPDVPAAGAVLRSQNSRKRFLDAAYRILSEESLSHLSIDHVSEVAGLSRRTFFLHFSSKDQLLAEVLEHLRPAHAEACRQWTDGISPDLPAEKRIEALFRSVIASISDPKWRGSAFLRVSAEFGERSGHPVHAVVAEAHRDMETSIEHELRNGDFDDPALIARQLATLANGLLVMQLIHRDPSYGEAVLAMLPAILAAGRQGQTRRR